MVEIQQIAIPWWQVAALLILGPAVLAAAVAGLRRLARTRVTAGEAPDWSVPPLAGPEGGNTLLHRWDVRCKLVTILGYSFMLTALTRPQPAVAAIGVSLLALIVSRASPAKVLIRLLAISGFLTMFLVVMPLTVPERPGDTLLVLNRVEWLGFNLRGLTLAATIAAKAVAIALLMEPLLATAPLPMTLHGLSRLGAPEMVGQMVLLSHRYLHVFRHEARRMADGMQVRGFRKRTDLMTLKAVANFLGMLFVRSFERTERVFDAMRARGYQGRFPVPAEPRLRPGDLLFSAVWLLAGVTLLVWDRLPS
jgi:cobalt/nickel transport system permease protein